MQRAILSGDFFSSSGSGSVLLRRDCRGFGASI